MCRLARSDKTGDSKKLVSCAPYRSGYVSWRSVRRGQRDTCTSIRVSAPASAMCRCMRAGASGNNDQAPAWPAVELSSKLCRFGSATSAARGRPVQRVVIRLLSRGEPLD